MRDPAHDAASFNAGRCCGTRVAACIARAAALELLERGRWWSRWRRRLMARTLVACAEELEREAEGVERAAVEGVEAPVERPGAGRDAIVRAVPDLPARAEERALEA